MKNIKTKHVVYQFNEVAGSDKYLTLERVDFDGSLINIYYQ